MPACRRLLLLPLLLLAAAGVTTDASFTPVVEALHEHMTADELAWYFGGGARVSVPDYQVVFLLPAEPELSDDGGPGEGHLRYSFSAFGRPVELRLRPNTVLAPPWLRVLRRERPGAPPQQLEAGPPPPCHYLHADSAAVAAVSLCHSRAVQGFVVLDNDTLEITPLSERLHALLRQAASADEASAGVGDGAAAPAGVPHIVRRAPFIAPSFAGDALPLVADREALVNEVSDIFEPERQRRGKASGYTVEAALFFDEAAYKLFAPFFHNSDERLRDMLLAYVNGVQALYHHPSLGGRVEISLVRLELMSSQPADLPHHDGERGALLDSFCAFSEKHNPKGDSDPNHWDMALYVSGLDFFAYENGRKSGVTMGLATVGGVCLEKYNCVIAELGTTNVFGKPYPSAGFTSVYVLAHEIGHNLGMHHDGTSNSCPKEGFIMSPSRGTTGETQWSTCSADVIRGLGSAKCLLDAPGPTPKERDHARFDDLPGTLWGAKRQCEVLLRDPDAVTHAQQNQEDICQNLKCRTPHRSGFYFAGPALEGTTCGKDKWCQGGSCVPAKRKKPPKVVKGGWSAWKPEACTSGCIIKSKGFQRRRRSCDNPKPVNTEEGCPGPSFDVVLCKDDKLCKKSKRQTAAAYATSACGQFAKLLPELDPKAAGLQAPHETARLWMGCAIFCRRKDTGSFYTPRLDLNDMGVDPYFPDGTWCHNEAGVNYYCQQHHCLPETGRMGKSLPPSEDVPLPQNAPPKPGPIPDELLRYLSVGPDGKPLLTTLSPGSTKPPPDEDWADHDYRELPAGATGR
ncbi:A disintegrin and metalloproteinase with thrombospondin motifs adt-2-like [Schistocerca serialis cubense]|uniref:A disintegrin and metalloproteinase with thrombospondin motifs adt-2-like n=1 Tax=Schistocerca serialis cubense TaxID=2023355 RepID=UPI00214E829A|nr:A disintegrin and metalloproteinase with thrombospondin motifs adt-2-like [Schistocerca serialis cubense]